MLQQVEEAGAWDADVGVEDVEEEVVEAAGGPDADA